MTAGPQISVVMPNYNGARYLRGAIHTILAQTLRSWELILVDDASTDDSLAVACKAARGDPRIKIMRQRSNSGAAAARNRALEAATGEWIAVFDSDDLMVPERLERLLQRARNDEANIVADNLMLFSDQDDRPHRYLRYQLGRTAHWVSLAAFIDSNRLYSVTPDLGYLKPMIKGDLVRRLHARYDESLRIGEDFNFLARIMANGHQLRIDPAAMYLYRKHGSSTSYHMGARDIHAMLEADKRLYRQAALTPEEHSALLRRKRSLEAQLVYDGVVAAIKHGDAARGATMALAEPRIWPLLTRPLTARLKRLGNTLAHKAAAMIPTGPPQGMA